MEISYVPKAVNGFLSAESPRLQFIVVVRVIIVHLFNI